MHPYRAPEPFTASKRTSEELPAGCKPFPSLLSPVPVTLQPLIVLLRSLATHQTRLLLLRLPRGLAGEKGGPASPGEVPCSPSVPQSLRGKATERKILFYSYIPADAASQLTTQGWVPARAGRAGGAGRTDHALGTTGASRARECHRTAGATAAGHSLTIPSHCPEDLEDLSKIGRETIIFFKQA